MSFCIYFSNIQYVDHAKQKFWKSLLFSTDFSMFCLDFSNEKSNIKRAQDTFYIFHKEIINIFRE